MAIDFPNTPALNDVFTADNGVNYTWDGTKWVATSATISTMPTGGGTNKVFYENSITITENYTLTTDTNAVSAGPVIVGTGATITIPTGSVWTVV